MAASVRFPGDTLTGRLLARLRRAPEGRALAFYDSTGRFTWRIWEEVVLQAAASSRALWDLGVRPGDACILALPSGEPAARLLLSALLAGVRPLLVAPPTLQGQNAGLVRILERVIARTRARLVVAPDLAADAPRFARRFPRTRFVEREEDLAGTATGCLPDVRPRRTGVVALQLTSGTTGFPRICVWTHRGVVAALDNMSEAMSLRSDDVGFNWTPLYHDMGLVNNFLLCLATGVPLAMMSPTEFVRRPASWLKGLAATGATQTWAPNFGFALATDRISEDEIQGVSLGHVRAFWNAAERIHLDTVLAFHERFKRLGVTLPALKMNFGCAENVGGATFSDPRGLFVVEQIDERTLQTHGRADVVDPLAHGRSSLTIVSAGRACPGITLRILSPRGRPLPDGHVGELALLTSSRMRGYLGDAADTRRAFRGRWLRTGDLGYLRKGEFFWVGRVRERITLRGRKLDPSEFERVLLHVPGLRTGCFAAFGVDDRVRGTQRVVVVVEARKTDSKALDTLRSEVRERIHLELGVQLDDLRLVPAGTLTKTTSGKRRHRHFREQYLHGELQRRSLGQGAGA
jgi:acyl-CoA synthetase (AMP-forming)/AMP-acid ligase II